MWQGPQVTASLQLQGGGLEEGEEGAKPSAPLASLLQMCTTTPATAAHRAMLD